MKLDVQKKLAAKILKCSSKKIFLDMTRADDLKESITKKDIRALIKEGAIKKTKTQEKSRVRAKKIRKQKHCF